MTYFFNVLFTILFLIKLTIDQKSILKKVKCSSAEFASQIKCQSDVSLKANKFGSLLNMHLVLVLSRKKPRTCPIIYT